MLSTQPSGLAAWTYYRWDSDALATYAAPVSMPTDGLHQLDFHSADRADLTNRDATSSLIFRLDMGAPSVPVTVSAVSADATSVAVGWAEGSDAMSGVDHYQLYVDGVLQPDVSATGTVVTGFAPRSLHYFSVATVDVAGNASYPSQAVYAAAGALPPLTTTAHLTPGTADGLDGWYVSTPTVTFSVEPSVAAYTHFAWDSSPSETYTAPLSTPEGTHTLSFWSVDQADQRAYEPTQQITLKFDSVVPETPSISATATTYDSVEIAWAPVANPPSGIAQYDVLMDGAVVGTTMETSYTVAGLSPDTQHTFQVVSVSSAGRTAPSSATVVRTPLAPVAPPPSIVLAKAPSGSYVCVNWTPSASTVGVVRYRVWRSNDGSTYSAIATTTGGVLGCSYIDSDVKSSTQYWYAVSVVDSRGEGDLSIHDGSVWPSIAPVTGRPSRPQRLAAIAFDNAVYLRWQASADPNVIGYYVLRSPSSLSNSVATLQKMPADPSGFSTTATAFFDLTVTNGQVYYYSVVAVDDSGTVGLPSLEIESQPQETTSTLEPHTYGNDQSACMCHSTHLATGGPPLLRWSSATTDTVCVSCHTGSETLGEFLDPLAVSKHAEGSVLTSETPFTCLSCHVPTHKSNEPTANLIRVNRASVCVVVTDTPPGDGFCLKCHGTGSTLVQGDLSVFEASAHDRVNAPSTGANIKCDACHESHSSRNEHLNRYTGYMVCMQCHTSSSSDPNQPDIWSRLQLSDDANSKVPVLPQDQTTGARMSCQNCHNTHSVTVDYPLVNPHNPGPSGVWTTRRSNEKAFCFTCHNGQPLPTSAETTPWADAVYGSNGTTMVANIEWAFSTNVHGYGKRSDASSTSEFLRPDMGYTYDTVLECRSCHDPHGTANNFSLQQSVVSAGGGKTIGGVVVTRAPSGGYDLRFFCSTCHLFDPETHDSMAGTSTVVFPSNCTTCHRHLSSGVPSPNL
jgi:predicted CXXCH cytochrome family protein